jgi:hypothetical protein
MGRPPIGRKAVTPAERQARRRKRLRCKKAKGEREAKLAANRAKYASLLAKNADATWTRVYWPPAPPLDNPADELVAQIPEAIELTPEITLADVQAAIAHRIEPPSPSPP